MSIRIAFLTLFVAGLAVYAWRDWFISLCGLILLMAVIEHPDMPKNIMDIQGLNPWNLLMADIWLAWLINRRGQGLRWDMPRHMNVMLVLYLVVILVGVFRMLVDRSGLEDFSTGQLISEYLVNCVKWVLPGLLLFDGCRTRRRAGIALSCILSLYFLLALQVIRWVPASAALDSDSLKRSIRLIVNGVGYSHINLSMMLAGACWAMLGTVILVRRRAYRILLIVAAGMVAYGQALTGGRMGYVTWGLVGLILCLLRWRKGLIVIPLVPLVISVVAPGVVERMLEGFGTQDASGQTYTDDDAVTSGRSVIWPHVVDKIWESPVVGYGRQAMIRTYLNDFLGRQYNEPFPHPHNAYLECLLDNGLVGFAVIIPFYIMVLIHAGRLFLGSRDPLGVAVGGVCLSLVLALLIASMGSQTFYPREGALGMWAGIGLMLRLSLVRSMVRKANPVVFPRNLMRPDKSALLATQRRPLAEKLV